jgi:hypothetical protein
VITVNVIIWLFVIKIDESKIILVIFFCPRVITLEVFNSKSLAYLKSIITVNLSYNKLGYNKLPVIANKFFPFFSPQIHIYYINKLGYNELLVILNKFGQSQAVHYNGV